MNDGEDNHPKYEGSPSPFDPKKLRIDQRFGEGQDVRRVLVSVPVRKPNRQEFFRTHPEPDMTLAAAVLEFKQDRQSFIVSPELAPYLPGEAAAKLLIPALTNHGALVLWPIRLPDEQGRLDDWNAVALEVAERAKTKWVRLMANMGAGTYARLARTGAHRRSDGRVPECHQWRASSDRWRISRRSSLVRPAGDSWICRWHIDRADATAARGGGGTVRGHVALT